MAQSDCSPGGALARRFRGFTVGVGVWLFALALVHLVGAAWFEVAEVSNASRARDQADEIKSAVEDVVSMTALRAPGR